MTLYELHDDGEGNLDWEERTWLAVWADTPDEAQAIFRQRLPSLTEYTREQAAGLALWLRPVAWKGDEFQPEQPWPHEEHRPEVLRSIGWKYEGERNCDACDLAAFGAREFAVCDECGLCRVCRPHTPGEPCECEFPIEEGKV